MCQSIAQGGRRCPLHQRSTKATLSYLSTLHDLDPRVTTFAFKQCMEAARNTSLPNTVPPSVFARWVEMMQRKVQESIDDGEVSEHEGAEMISRLQESLSDPMPTPQTFAALKAVRMRARHAAEARKRLIADTARPTRRTIAQTAALFASYEDELLTEHGAYGSFDNPLPQALYDAAERVSRPATPSATYGQRGRPLEDHPYAEAWYDPEDGFLTVIPVGYYSTAHYANVPESVVSSLSEMSEYEADRILANDLYSVAGIYDHIPAERRFLGIRCDSCGQFTSPLGHSCPGDQSDDLDDDGEVRDESPGVEISPTDEVVAHLRQQQSRIQEARARLFGTEEAQEDEEEPAAEHNPELWDVDPANRSTVLAAELGPNQPSSSRYNGGATTRSGWNEEQVAVLQEGTVLEFPVLRTTRSSSYAQEYDDSRPVVISGNVQVYLDSPDGNLQSILPDSLTCSCQEWEDGETCRHTRSSSSSSPINRAWVHDAQTWVERASEDLTAARGDDADTPEVLSALDAMSAVDAQDWQGNAQRLEERIPPYVVGVDRSYLANLDEYISDYRQAREQVSRGEEAIPLFTSVPVTQGVCSPDSGRAFGIEIEYDVDSYNDGSEVSAAIARAMYREGLTDYDRMQRWHYNARARNPYSRWSVEYDSTVCGEIVSPLLHDTEETWQIIDRVCQVVRDNGGTASTRTGQHVHMGTARGESLEETARLHGRILGIYGEHEDSIRRVQTDPRRGTHRGTSYCNPLRSTALTRLVYDLQRGNIYHDSNHSTSVNMGYQNRIEFRGSDGSLHAGHIQAQVMTYAALVAAAERDVTPVTHSLHQQVGLNASRLDAILGSTSRRRNLNPDLTDDQLIVSDAPFRNFVTSLFPSEEGRKMMVGIAASVGWQRQ